MTAEHALAALDEIAEHLAPPAARAVRRAIGILREISPELREPAGPDVEEIVLGAVRAIPLDVLTDELIRRGLAAGG